MSPAATPDQKLERLREILSHLGRALIAFSGGLDSTFLLAVAGQVLGEGVLAVTIRGEIFPPYELEEAGRLASALGARHIYLDIDLLRDQAFAQNPPHRCYLCKKVLFSELMALARDRGLGCVLDGSHSDDLGRYRPGRQALVELGVRSPLLEAGLGKVEVRLLSRQMGLPTWDKPPVACLATRIPYGERITPERLRRIDRAESFLRDLGFRGVRVRDHGDTARIEVERERLAELATPAVAERVVGHFKGLGYTYVALDLEGYRPGSMDQTLGEGYGSGKDPAAPGGPRLG